MVNKRGDQLSKIITGLFLLVLVVFVVVVVREFQKPGVQVSRNTPGPQDSLATPALKSSEMLLTVEVPGLPEGSLATSQAPQYFLPEDITMEMVDDMDRRADGGVQIQLKNGQQLLLSASEVNKLDPKIRFYVQYDREADGSP